MTDRLLPWSRAVAVRPAPAVVGAWAVVAAAIGAIAGVCRSGHRDRDRDR